MQQSSRAVIVGLGEILWDLLPDGMQLGGAPANFAYHAHGLGAQTAIVSCVGDDDLGRRILERLDAWGVDRSHVAVDPLHPTGTVSVTMGPEGIPDYIIHTNVAWDFIPWSDGLAHLAARADAACFGSLAQRAPVSHATIHRFLEAAGPDCLKVCDINLRQAFYGPEVVADMLEEANILKLNDEELPTLARLLGLSDDPANNADRLLRRLADAYGLALIALTRGRRGSYLFTPARTSDHPGYPARVIDTVGAGDAFTAALVMGFLRGEDLDAVNAAANRLAATVCAHKGATPDIYPLRKT